MATNIDTFSSPITADADRGPKSDPDSLVAMDSFEGALAPRNDPDKGALFALLDRFSHLDLAGKVRNQKTQRGHGGYSDVFIGTYKPANGLECKVAVKRLRIHVTTEKKFQNRLAREIYVWSKLKHPNVLSLLGFYIEDGLYPHLISRWMENGTIMHFLENNPAADIFSLVKSIAEGLRYLHAKEVVHADVKPENVLISDSGEPLLCDFGLSSLLESTMTFKTSTRGGARGTLRYMAKEVILLEDGMTYCKEADVWAFGMTVYAIMTKRLPYHHIPVDAAVILKVYDGELPSWPEDSKSWPSPSRELQDICAQCWLGKSERPSMEDIVSRLDPLPKYPRMGIRTEPLETMQSQLESSMFDIESSYLRNNESPKLEDHVKNGNGSNRRENGVLPSSATLGSPDVPVSSSTLDALSYHPSTPSAAQSRRAKNAAHRANDVEFAFEIGSGLLTEVRRLQSLLGERDKTIQNMKEEYERGERRP